MGGESAAGANGWWHSCAATIRIRSGRFVPRELFLFNRFFANPTHVWKLPEMWQNINFFKTRMKIGFSHGPHPSDISLISPTFFSMVGREGGEG